MGGKSDADTLEYFAKAFLAAKTDTEKQEVWAEYQEWQQAENKRLASLYPPDPPNKECHTAVVSGLLLSNGAGFRPGDLTRYFSFGRENVHIWTHTENEYPQLVVDVSLELLPPGQLWKTLASCLEIVATFSSACEHLYEFAYHWIYRFEPRMPIDEQEFFGFGRDENILALVDIRKGAIHDLWFIADHADLLELLQRDDRFFVAAQHFFSSIRNHWFCITCELGGDPMMHHPSHEPASWEAIQVSPALDVAMVQASRCAEALLGQPGRGKNRSRLVHRWGNAISLDPGETFERVGWSYLDYFCAMYGDRNQAAHSRGKIPFDVVRRRVIDAQCFAWQVLSSYFEMHAVEPAAAQALLGFNVPLLDRERRGYTTKMTDPRYGARHFEQASE